MIIGPADICFELWFNNQKLSRDQAIKVDWTPAESSPPMSPLDLSTYNRAELPDTHPTQMSGGLQGMNGHAQGQIIRLMSPGIDRTGTAIEDLSGDDKKGRRGLRYPSSLLGRARGGKWPVYG